MKDCYDFLFSDQDSRAIVHVQLFGTHQYLQKSISFYEKSGTEYFLLMSFFITGLTQIFTQIFAPGVDGVWNQLITYF